MQLVAIAMILLIITAGGVFKQVLKIVVQENKLAALSTQFNHATAHFALGYCIAAICFPVPLSSTLA